MKRISPATVTFGVMAIVLGLVAAYIIRQALEKPPIVERPAPPPAAPEMVPVIFAKNVIPRHTRLTPDDVFIGQVPKSSKRPPGVFRGVNLVEGRITKESIPAGRMIREDYLLAIDEALPDLAARIPAGHRAVTILVAGADTGGKRLAEGDHIDIAMTVEGTHPDLGEVMTRTLMRNVLIVDAAQGRPLERGRRLTTEPDAMITVAVSPADANKLIVAQRTGLLQATLVSATDQAGEPPAADDAVSRRQLLGLKEVVPPKRFTVEQWSGSSVRILEMSDARIQESREASIRRQPAASTAAPAANDFTRNIPSGVKAPGYTADLAPVAAALSEERVSASAAELN